MYSMFEDKLQNCSLGNLNKYLYNGKSEIKVNTNNRGKGLTNTASVGEPVNQLLVLCLLNALCQFTVLLNLRTLVSM
jgi:hypothetical protein